MADLCVYKPLCRPRHCFDNLYRPDPQNNSHLLLLGHEVDAVTERASERVRQRSVRGNSDASLAALWPRPYPL